MDLSTETVEDIPMNELVATLVAEAILEEIIKVARPAVTFLLPDASASSNLTLSLSLIFPAPLSLFFPKSPYLPDFSPLMPQSSRMMSVL